MGFKFEKLSILVVEDLVPMQQLVMAVLETLGVGRIFTAEEGGRGYEIFRAKNPDIVLTDWHMLPVGGMELLGKIRRDPDSPNKMAPVIVMTGYSALPRVSQARDMGTTEYLVKPFTAEDLARRIAHVISKPHDFVETGDYFGPDRRRFFENYAGPMRREMDKDT